MGNKHDAYFENIRAIGIFLDHKWSVEAQDNKRVFLIDTWQEVDALLGRLIGHRILLFRSELTIAGCTMVPVQSRIPSSRAVATLADASAILSLQ
jgi:hypothetical protein